MSLVYLSLVRTKPGSRKDAVPPVPDNTDRLLAYIEATRRREPNTMDWEGVRRLAESRRKGAAA